MKIKSLKACPNCGSIDIKSELTAYIGPLKYHCEKCKYESHLFPEIKIKDIKKFQKSLRK